MDNCLKRVLTTIICFCLCIPTFAVEDTEDIPIITGSKTSTQVTENVDSNDKSNAGRDDTAPTNSEPSEGNKQVNTGVDNANASEAIEIISEPTIPTARTESSVRSVVGDSVEIINIDGLEVPLADGSTFYIPFVDIAADAYYTPAVAWAYANDITAGVTELSFGPNATCTRGQMVTFLWRAAGCPEPTGTVSAFSDVAEGAYYAKAVAWAVENGITNGMSPTKFQPDGIVNRAQTVTFLWRAKGKPAASAATQFTDVPAGEYYADAVAWAVANNITNGVSPRQFAPGNNCVRGQTVTFLYRAYK